MNKPGTHLREEEFIPYLESRLVAADCVRVECHLRECGECRTRVAELRSLMGVLEEWTPMEPSPAFDAGVRRRIAEEASQPSVWAWLRLRPAFGAGLVLVALLAGAAGLWQIPLPEEVSQTAVAELDPDATIELLPAMDELLREEGELELSDNQELLENYELLEQFDIFFEGVSP